MSKEYVLGIDTSNYTTSVALVDNKGYTVKDIRRMLMVKKGEKGLRQSTAFFQHVNVLPELIKECTTELDGRIVAIAVSTKPRSVAGSYMPVFKAGESIAYSMAYGLGVPCFSFSHQEGHLACVKPREVDSCYGFHLSGGTCEILEITGENIEIIGGSKDISFGQVIDRIGVAMGYDFPCGQRLDQLALNKKASQVLKDIKVEKGWINLSGMETQCQRALEKNIDHQSLAAELFEKIGKAILTMSKDCDPMFLMGGVASSKTLQKAISGGNIYFPSENMGRDNGVGIARLGKEKLWG